jgi:hypothetical protein
MKSLRIFAAALLVSNLCVLPEAHAYVLNRTIAAAGGCPQVNAQRSSAGGVDRRWNTTLNSNIVTSAGGTSQRIAEVEAVIQESFAVWTAVGTGLAPSSLAALTQIQNPTSNDCNALDGFNTICFNQTASFSSSVLAFTTTVTSDQIGETLGNKQSQFIGQILDADVLFNTSSSSGFSFATPSALPSNLSSFDLESVLIHELGHFFGFSHSGVLRAMMYPFAPPRGQFTGDRPTAQAPDAPLAEDDRAGLRVLYPNPQDPNIGVIRGRVLPANPISLAAGVAAQPTPGPLTGMWGTHVVAVDADTGAVVAGTLGGWSCNPASPPTQFDGTFVIEGLPVGTAQNPRRYKLFVEPLDSPTDASNISNALRDLCRPTSPTPCRVPCNPEGAFCDFDSQGNPRGNPVVNTNFSTKVRP